MELNFQTFKLGQGHDAVALNAVVPVELPVLDHFIWPSERTVLQTGLKWLPKGLNNLRRQVRRIYSEAARTSARIGCLWDETTVTAITYSESVNPCLLIDFTSEVNDLRSFIVADLPIC